MNCIGMKSDTLLGLDFGSDVVMGKVVINEATTVIDVESVALLDVEVECG